MRSRTVTIPMRSRCSSVDLRTGAMDSTGMLRIDCDGADAVVALAALTSLAFVARSRPALLRPAAGYSPDFADGCRMLRGDTRIRTGDGGFADLCLTTWLCRRARRSPFVGAPFSPPECGVADLKGRTSIARKRC